MFRAISNISDFQHLNFSTFNLSQNFKNLTLAKAINNQSNKCFIPLNR